MKPGHVLIKTDAADRNPFRVEEPILFRLEGEGVFLALLFGRVTGCSALNLPASVIPRLLLPGHRRRITARHQSDENRR